jgi:hypothetical protein
MAAAAATLAGLALVALTAAAHAQPVELVSGVPFNGTVALRNSILFVVRGGFSGSVRIGALLLSNRCRARSSFKRASLARLMRLYARVRCVRRSLSRSRHCATRTTQTCLFGLGL